MKESLLEILYLTKCCLKTFWFWVPILYAVYLFVQLWMIFFIHPLTILILPAVLIIYGTRQEQKSMEAQQGILKTKLLKPSHGLGVGPQPIPDYRQEIEKAVEEYTRFLKKKRNKKTRRMTTTPDEWTSN